MSAETLIKATSRILANGPDRVLVQEDGIAVSSKRAREVYDITPDIIFIRDDGWSLGAPKHLADIAEATWENHWNGVLLRPLTTSITYVKYLKLKSVLVDPIMNPGPRRTPGTPFVLGDNR